MIHYGDDQWRGKYVMLFSPNEVWFKCTKDGGTFEVDNEDKVKLECKKGQGEDIGEVES